MSARIGLTASGNGCLGSAALGFLQVLFRPASPTLGHPRDREEAPDLLPVEGVDAENIAEGESVSGAYLGVRAAAMVVDLYD